MAYRSQRASLTALHEKIEQQVCEAVDCIEFMLEEGMHRGETLEKSGFGLKRLHHVHEALNHCRSELKCEIDELAQQPLSDKEKRWLYQSYNQLMNYLDQTQGMLLSVLKESGYLRQVNPSGV